MRFGSADRRRRCCVYALAEFALDLIDAWRVASRYQARVTPRCRDDNTAEARLTTSLTPTWRQTSDVHLRYRLAPGTGRPRPDSR